MDKETKIQKSKITPVLFFPVKKVSNLRDQSWESRDKPKCYMLHMQNMMKMIILYQIANLMPPPTYLLASYKTTALARMSVKLTTKRES